MSTDDPKTHGHDHGHDHGQSDGHDHHEEHDHGPVFINVFIALCLLTAGSFAVGHFLVGPELAGTPRQLVGWTLMMVISCAKALLVISFFMHLRWEANWKYVLTIPATIMSLFLLLMLVPDVGNRGATATEERQRFSAVPEPSDAGDEEQSAGHGKQHKGHDH